MSTSKLRQNLGNCCHSLSGARIILGEGPPKAKVMLIGQNPGADEDRLGRPFVGRSGKYLNKVLKENNIKREALFITNVVKCKTPGNRKPTQKEIDACLPLLEEQLKLVKPKLVILMGAVAWQTPRLEGIQFFETYHPAAAMRFANMREKFEADFKKIGQMLQTLKTEAE